MLSGLIRMTGIGGEGLQKRLAAIMPDLSGSAVLEPASVQHIAGWRLRVSLPHQHEHRTLADCEKIIAASGMDTDWGGGGWGGLTAEIKTFAPWEFAIEGAYGEVDMGEIKHYTQFGDKKGRTFDLHRHGWYVGARVDYHFDWGTLGALGWYSSGDDDNPYNGSERMPMFNSQWPVTPLGFGGCYTDLSPWKVLGHGGGCGLTGGVAYLKNVSFIDRLKHTLKVGYFQGTNSPEMPRKANMTHYPTFADGPMAYLTTTDHAWDFSLSNTYKMYENLEINLEGSYVNLFLKNDTWKGVEDSQHKDNWIVSMTFNYTF